MAILGRGSSFSNMKDLEDELQSIFGDVSDDGDSDETSLSRWSPRIDIFEENKEIVIECEIPGVEKNDLDVSFQKNRLTISGQRRQEREINKERNYLRRERIYDSFQRSFRLPDDINPDGISAEYDNGVLSVTVPKKENSQSRHIDIT